MNASLQSVRVQLAPES